MRSDGRRPEATGPQIGTLGRRPEDLIIVVSTPSFIDLGFAGGAVGPCLAGLVLVDRVVMMLEAVESDSTVPGGFYTESEFRSAVVTMANRAASAVGGGTVTPRP